jgi:putative transposase
VRDLALRGVIEQIVLALPGYGYRRVTKTLQREGWSVNHKRVLRVMREECLLCQLRRRFVVTTASQHTHATYPNLLRDLRLHRIDQAWVADITYIRLPDGVRLSRRDPRCLFASQCPLGTLVLV